MHISPSICSQNRLYLPLSFYLIFQDLPKHMIGYVVLIPDYIEKIAICLDDGLLQLKNKRKYFIYICVRAWHGKALQWRQHDKLCRVGCLSSSKFCNAFSKFFGMVHTLLSFVF